MLFKLPITLLSNAPKIFLPFPSHAPLCPIMLHKLMLLSLKINIFLTTPISEQLRELNFTISTQISTVFNIRLATFDGI